MGVGFLVNNDKIGSYNNQNVYGYYAYKILFPKGTLSMGLSAGFNLMAVDFSALDLQNPGDPSFAPLNKFKPNFGTGLYYSQKNFFVGFSIPFILNSDLRSDLEGTAEQIKESRYYFLRSGVVYPVTPKETVKLNPSILVRAQEGQPLSVDLNMAVILHDVVSTGVSWRSGDALINFIDLKISEKFHFAYSYDWTTSEIRRFSNGSHELMLNYRTRITGIHKNILCPTYYSYR
jgi:type IX secretion system PorP/SprF family membrane protein